MPGESRGTEVCEAFKARCQGPVMYRCLPEGGERSRRQAEDPSISNKLVLQGP